MTRLFLLRHAKAAPATGVLRDFDRPLDESGHDESSRVGRMMAAEGYAPAVVLCSPARRTRETLTGISAIGAIGEATFPDVLYSGDTGGYLDAIARHRSATSLLVVGHNPMVEAIAKLLVGDGEHSSRRRLMLGYPTAALSVVSFSTPLDRIDAGSGFLEAFLTPADD